MQAGLGGQGRPRLRADVERDPAHPSSRSDLPAAQTLRGVRMLRVSHQFLTDVSLLGNLWYRQGVTPSHPQGDSWEHVSNNVRHVSVGPLDQVWGDGDGGWMLPLGAGTRGVWFPLWSSPPRLLSPWTLCRKEREGAGFSRSLFQVWVIADKVQGSHSLSRGTVCRRTGVQSLEPKGQGWDYGIGVSRHWAAVLAGVSRRPGVGWGGPWAEPLEGPTPWRERLCPLTPSWPWVIPFSSPRGAGITSPSGPVPPGPPRVHPRSQPASRMGSPRAWPVARGRPPAPSAAEATSPHWEQL